MSDRHVEYMAVADIRPAESNPKAHDEAGIRKSIEHFGVGELPLLDERTGRLVAGHGRIDGLAHLEGLGRKPPAGVRVREDGAWLVPVIRGWASRTDDDARAYVIASNKLTEKGGWDDRALLEDLSVLADSVLLDVTGFTSVDVDNLEALLDLDAWDEPAAKPKKADRDTSFDPDDFPEDDEDAPADDDEAPGLDDSEMWPRIDVRVRPDVFDAWRLLIEEHDGKDDAARLEDMLRKLGHLA